MKWRRGRHHDGAVFEGLTKEQRVKLDAQLKATEPMAGVVRPMPRLAVPEPVLKVARKRKRGVRA